MPISIDEFDSRDDSARTTDAECVLRFLARNRAKAYEPIEIVRATGVDESSIRPVLNRLESRGLVRHKEPHWAVGDLDAVREAFVFHSAASGLDDELGPESREEWLAAADESDEQT
jgi:predicted transcriptional regulator